MRAARGALAHARAACMPPLTRRADQLRVYWPVARCLRAGEAGRASKKNSRRRRQGCTDRMMGRQQTRDGRLPRRVPETRTVVPGRPGTGRRRVRRRGTQQHASSGARGGLRVSAGVQRSGKTPTTPASGPRPRVRVPVCGVCVGVHACARLRKSLAALVCVNTHVFTFTFYRCTYRVSSSATP